MTDYAYEESETDRLSDELKRDEAAALATVQSISAEIEGRENAIADVSKEISKAFGGFVTPAEAEYNIRYAIKNVEPVTNDNERRADR